MEHLSLSINPEKSQIIGCIFPILPNHVSNLFSQNQPVFVKFTKFYLNFCSKIIFYVSGKKILVCEAKVKKIRKMNQNQVWSSYGTRLFLGKKEYDKYATISPIGKSYRKIKTITVFELRKPKKFFNDIHYFSDNAFGKTSYKNNGFKN